LVGDVFRYAPADLTSAERLVLLALAEDAPHSGPFARVSRYSSVARLSEYTGLRPGTVKNALSSLAARCLIQRMRAKAHEGAIQHYKIAELGDHHRSAVHLVRESPDSDPLEAERVTHQ
jgi:DNA-binding MarR family transcriptional regulator